MVPRVRLQISAALPSGVEAAKDIIAAGALPRDTVFCLSKDAFRKEAALRVEGQPSNASPKLFYSHLAPCDADTRTGVARRLRCALFGASCRKVLLRWKYAVVRGAVRASAGELATRDTTRSKLDTIKTNKAPDAVVTPRAGSGTPRRAWPPGTTSARSRSRACPPGTGRRRRRRP